jgi:hypothetical protein
MISMKTAPLALALVAAVGLAACGGSDGPTVAGPTASAPPAAPPTPAPTPAPTPTPRPAASVGGLWLVDSGNLTGYGIDVSQSGTRLEGRSVFPVRDVTGPLVGEVSPSGRVTWSTAYGNGATDSFDGQLSADGRTIDGVLTFDIPAARFRGSAPILLTFHRP